MLSGRFSRAGELGSQLHLKRGLSSDVLSEIEYLFNCEAECSRSSGIRLYWKNHEIIHVKSSIKATRAIVDCLADNDEKLHMRFSVFQLTSIFRSLLCVEYKNFISTLKYYTAYPLAFYLGNELPPRPKGLEDYPGNYPFPSCNSIRRYLKERMMSKTHKKQNCKLFWSLLQGVKRACEDAGDGFIRETMVKHAATLSRHHPIDEDLEERYRLNFEEFFKDFKPHLSERFEMSNSASWEYRRSDGGARARLLDEANDIGRFVSTETRIYFRMISGTACSVLYGMHEIRPGVIKELRGVRCPTTMELYYLALSDREVHNSLPAMVAAILEPLKVRLITKGPAADYFLAKSMQKELLKYIQRFPQFELTGDSLRPDHIYRMLEREKSDSFEFMEFSHFVSGDYSAATDNLGLQYTLMGFEEAMDAAGLHYKWKSMYRPVLWGHQIHYPNKFELPEIRQENGQLMGSPLSFPFLCTANLIAYKLSLEDWLPHGTKLNFRDLPVLVNGDDILFRTNPDHYEIWKKHVFDIGFNLSVGKNYIHKNVLTINSTMYHYKKNGQFELIPYCNFGLLSGTSELNGSRGEKRCKAIDLKDAYISSVGGASNKPLAHSKFLTRNEKDIDIITSRGRYNLFVPVEVGGLGFPKYDGIEHYYTRFQRLLAKLVLRDPDAKRMFGFVSESGTNTLEGYESRNKKFFHIGYGPYNKGVRELSRPLYTALNSSFLTEPNVRWFSVIPEKYDPEKLFPFRLKEKDHLDHEGLRTLQYFLTDENPPSTEEFMMLD